MTRHALALDADNGPAMTPDVLPPDSETTMATGLIRHLLLISAVFILWSWSLSRVDQGALGDVGLIGILPAAAFVALAVMVAGFASVARSDPTGRIQGVYVVTLTVMIHGLPIFAYEHLRLSWAWQNVGVVDYVQRFGEIDPTISANAIAHNWPGFFALNGWLVGSSNLESALSYAAWSPLIFNLLFVAALYLLFRGFTTNNGLIWTATLFFVLANWVGQDYFAPQAPAFFFYLLVLAIALRWFRTDPDATIATAGDRIEPGTVASFALSTVLALSLVAITILHELTPVMAIIALGALVVFRVVRISWPFYTMLILTAAWMLGPARDFVVNNLSDALRDLNGFQANVTGTAGDLGPLSNAQAQLAVVARLLTGGVVGLATFGWLRSRKAPVGWAALVAAAPLVIILLNPFGGEMVFRTYLFALPFLAFLAASLWFADDKDVEQQPAPWSLVLVSLAMMTALLVAAFGGDVRNVYSTTEVEAADFVAENGQPGSLLVEANRDYPGKAKNAENFSVVTLDELPEAALDRVLDDPATTLARWLADADYTGGYVVLTNSQQASITRLGTMPGVRIQDITASLLASDLFVAVYQADDAFVFAPVGSS